MTDELSPMAFPLVRHHTFYFNCVTFQVNDTLFRVPPTQLQNRGIFKTLFSLPTNEAEGQTDAKPIVLEGLRTEDFAGLLKLLYSFHMNPLYLSESEWIGVLRLSTMWEMTDIRQKAIIQLSGMKATPVQQVLLGREFRVKKWLLQGYTKLVNGPLQWETWAAENLDWETKAKLLFVACLANERKCSHNSGSIENDLKSVFGTELKDMEEDGGSQSTPFVLTPPFPKLSVPPSFPTGTTSSPLTFNFRA